MASSPFSSSMPLFFLLFLQVRTSKTSGTMVCPSRNCSTVEKCGYEGFEVLCDDRNQTILHLSEAGDFVVDSIDYANQYMLVKDPDHCLPKRILEDQFRSPSWRFGARDYESFTLANCSSRNSSTIGPGIAGVVWLDCLSLAQDTVVALVTDEELAPLQLLWQECNLSMISVPRREQHPTDVTESMWLSWFEPDCIWCEAGNGRCAPKGSQGGSEVTCIIKHGLSTAARIAMALLFASPWFMCIFGCVWFLKVRVFVLQRLDQIRSNHFPGSALRDGVGGEAVEMAWRNAVGVTTGISSPAIKSYPKTRVDDLGQLPRPDDDVCAICLSKYERNETIRTIPECRHYFHAYCIDRWLRKNASCPLCRNYKG
ncbi:hypothetical protein BT93_E0600 [Corymbia citriodora subsp. variegata]|nr:hypothetical protein BT93_E0600 [Corymbia citriodora subsp. variegata]